MAYRITNIDSTAQKVYDIPLSSGMQTYATWIYDNTTTGPSAKSLVMAVYCEDPEADGSQKTLCEFSSGATVSLAVTMQRSSGSWILQATFADGNIASYTMPISPVGKWLLISFTHFNRSTINDRLYYSIYDFSTGLTHVSSFAATTDATATTPTHAAICNYRKTAGGTAHNMLGICVPAMLDGAWIDGTVTVDTIKSLPLSALAAKGPMGHVAPGTIRARNIYINGTPTGGTFTLTYNGETTGTLNHNATAAQVQTALEALTSLVPGDVDCYGGPAPGSPIMVRFAATSPAELAVGTNSLTGGSSPSIQIGDTCRWATNYTNSVRTGTDTRDGKACAGTIYGLDTTVGSQFGYHQYAFSCSQTGTVLAVDPFAHTSTAYPAPDDATVGSEALPATALTLAASGTRGTKATKLANWINEGTGAGQLRVGTFGNSRAVYPNAWLMRLSDGTYPARKFFTNFTDMGIVGQEPLWTNGHIVGMTVPVPCNNWSGSANTLDGAYGIDCEAGLLRCKDAGGTVVNPSAVFTVMTNTTLGTRMTMTARAANTPASSAGSSLNAYGAGNCVRLGPDCTARWMIRPELGLPVTDPLTITLRFLNHPNSASIAGVRKVVGSSQNGVEDSSSAVAAPGLGQSTDPAPVGTVVITAVSAAVLASQIAHTDYGYITVDDSTNNFADLEPGDLVQIHDNLGVTNVYNEAFVVYAVTGQGTTDCNIYYEWIPRQAPVVGDLVSFIKGQTILQEVTVTFTAGEVAAGKWRGIEVVADGDGDGLLLYEIEFNNPSGTGLHPVAIGRTGCGAWIQAARWPRVEDASGMSLAERHFANWDLDVIVLTTADQGTAGGHYVNSYNTLIDYVQADSPGTEIVVYATGPEWVGESTKDVRDAGNKYDWAAAMQHAANAAGVIFTAYQVGRNTSAFTRIVTGDDATEGPVHPGTVLDWTFIGAQLAGLRAEATNLSHGMGGRRRSALRMRG